VAEVSTTSAAPETAHPDEPVIYIRGAGGVLVDRRRLGSVAVGLCLLALSTLTVLLAVDAAAQDSREGRLKAFGLRVSVAVTSCVGLASGTGITASGFACRGSFVLDGERYDEAIRGSTALHRPGDLIDAVVIAGDPASVSTLASQRGEPSGLKPFILPVTLALAAAVIALLRWGRPFRGRRLRRGPLPTKGDLVRA
jgi:hypothetical protein